MKGFSTDDGCSFNKAFIQLERNKGNEVLNSGEIQDGYCFSVIGLFRG
jgi:hypothetical protein